MENKTRFNDWEEFVDCNECARYWDDSCSGAVKEKPCRSYVATRKVDIPKRMKVIEKQIDRAKTCCIISIVCGFISLAMSIWVLVR